MLDVSRSAEKAGGTAFQYAYRPQPRINGRLPHFVPDNRNVAPQTTSIAQEKGKFLQFPSIFLAPIIFQLNSQN
jgi:hypothetical protein